jgi:biotin carboxylase
VSPIEAFDKVQSKVEFCRPLDELALRQPGWSLVTSADDVAAVGFPCWMKAEYSTAGRGVRHVVDQHSAARAFAELGTGKVRVLVQQPAAGTYAQVAALFCHGRLVAIHCGEQVGMGAGGSAAARIGVDHPLVREAMTRLGAHLAWHGGLTLDYLHVHGEAQYIECNPRTVEPGNAAVSGVDLPRLTIAISRGDTLPSSPVVGRPGQRIHSAMALMLGAAEHGVGRAAVLGSW